MNNDERKPNDEFIKMLEKVLLNPAITAIMLESRIASTKKDIPKMKTAIEHLTMAIEAVPSGTTRSRLESLLEMTTERYNQMTRTIRIDKKILPMIKDGNMKAAANVITEEMMEQSKGLAKKHEDHEGAPNTLDILGLIKSRLTGDPKQN